MDFYAFYLFRPQPNEDPLKAAQAMFPSHMKSFQHSMDLLKHEPHEAPKPPVDVVDPDMDDMEGAGAVPVDEKELIREGLATMKFELSQALVNRNPELHYPEAVQIAVQVGTPLEKACRPFRELTLRAEATNDIRIDLFDFGARISVPYAIIGDEVRQIFGEVWEYIHILKRSHDYLAYDPQLGRMIRNTADMILAMTGYEYLYAEQLRAEGKAKGLFPENADEILPDDATQKIRMDHLLSPGYPTHPTASSPTPEGGADDERRRFDDKGHGSVAAGTGAGYQPATPSDHSSSPSRKSWWKFW